MRKLLLIALCALFVLTSRLNAEPIREFEQGMGRVEGPRMVDLASIPQNLATPEEEELNQYEKDEIFRDRSLLTPAGPPAFIPQHKIQLDRSIPEFQHPDPLNSMQAAAPTLKKTFAGPQQVIRQQPDCILAVGPSQVIVAVNATMTIYNKLGQKKFSTSLESWFSSLDPITGGVNLFDPKLIYDNYNNHFIFVVNARRADHRAWFLMSVSKTNNAQGAWAFYAVEMGKNGNTITGLWADLPRIGFDENAIYLSCNMTTFNSFLFRYAKVRVLKKSEVYTFKPLTYHDFWAMKDISGVLAINIEPVQSFGTAPFEYLISATDLSGNNLTLWIIKDAVSATPHLTKRGISVSSYQLPPMAPQKGGVDVIFTGDYGVSNAIFRNGALFTSYTTAFTWPTGGSVAAIRFWQIDPVNATVTQEITYGSAGFSYYFPAVMVDQRNDALLVFNRSSASEFAGIFTAGRAGTAPLGTLQSTLKIQAGISNYQNPFPGTNISRWGDYNGIAWDADDSFWLFSQFAKNKENYASTVARVSY